MGSHNPTFIVVAFALSATLYPSARAEDHPKLNQALQDHVAYVTTFAMPVVIEKCGATNAAYLQQAATLYLRYVNTHQDQIERGRMLTLAELAPDETLRSYRETTLAKRVGMLDTGTPEQKQRICEGALSVLRGRKMPGQWPPLD